MLLLYVTCATFVVQVISQKLSKYISFNDMYIRDIPVTSINCFFLFVMYSVVDVKDN